MANYGGAIQDADNNNNNNNNTLTCLSMFAPEGMMNSMTPQPNAATVEAYAKLPVAIRSTIDHTSAFQFRNEPCSGQQQQNNGTTESAQSYIDILQAGAPYLIPNLPNLLGLKCSYCLQTMGNAHVKNSLSVMLLTDKNRADNLKNLLKQRRKHLLEDCPHSVDISQAERLFKQPYDENDPSIDEFFQCWTDYVYETFYTKRNDDDGDAISNKVNKEKARTQQPAPPMNIAVPSTAEIAATLSSTTQQQRPAAATAAVSAGAAAAANVSSTTQQLPAAFENTTQVSAGAATAAAAQTSSTTQQQLPAAFATNTSVSAGAAAAAAVQTSTPSTDIRTIVDVQEIPPGITDGPNSLSRDLNELYQKIPPAMRILMTTTAVCNFYERPATNVDPDEKYTQEASKYLATLERLRPEMAKDALRLTCFFCSCCGTQHKYVEMKDGIESGSAVLITGLKRLTKHRCSGSKAFLGKEKMDKVITYNFNTGRKLVQDFARLLLTHIQRVYFSSSGKGRRVINSTTSGPVQPHGFATVECEERQDRMKQQRELEQQQLREQKLKKDKEKLERLKQKVAAASSEKRQNGTTATNAPPNKNTQSMAPRKRSKPQKSDETASSQSRQDGTMTTNAKAKSPTKAPPNAPPKKNTPPKKKAPRKRVTAAQLRELEQLKRVYDRELDHLECSMLVPYDSDDEDCLDCATSANPLPPLPAPKSDGDALIPLQANDIQKCSWYLPYMEVTPQSSLSTNEGRPQKRQKTDSASTLALKESSEKLRQSLNRYDVVIPGEECSVSLAKDIFDLDGNRYFLDLVSRKRDAFAKLATTWERTAFAKEVINDILIRQQSTFYKASSQSVGGSFMLLPYDNSSANKDGDINAEVLSYTMFRLEHGFNDVLSLRFIGPSFVSETLTSSTPSESQPNQANKRSKVMLVEHPPMLGLIHGVVGWNVDTTNQESPGMSDIIAKASKEIRDAKRARTSCNGAQDITSCINEAEKIQDETANLDVVEEAAASGCDTGAISENVDTQQSLDGTDSKPAAVSENATATGGDAALSEKVDTQPSSSGTVAAPEEANATDNADGSGDTGTLQQDEMESSLKNSQADLAFTNNGDANASNGDATVKPAESSQTATTINLHSDPGDSPSSESTEEKKEEHDGWL